MKGPAEVKYKICVLYRPLLDREPRTMIVTHSYFVVVALDPFLPPTTGSSRFWLPPFIENVLNTTKTFYDIMMSKKKGRVHAQGLEQNYWIVVCKIERVSANKFAYGVRIQNYLLKAGSHRWRSRDSGRGVLLYEATHVVACENRSAHNFRFGIGRWTLCLLRKATCNEALS